MSAIKVKYQRALGGYKLVPKRLSEMVKKVKYCQGFQYGNFSFFWTLLRSISKHLFSAAYDI